MFGNWIMAHPWMTFFLAAMLICAINNTIANICMALHEGKSEEDEGQEPPEEE